MIQKKLANQRSMSDASIQHINNKFNVANVCPVTVLILLPEVDFDILYFRCISGGQISIRSIIEFLQQLPRHLSKITFQFQELFSLLALPHCWTLATRSCIYVNLF